MEPTDSSSGAQDGDPPLVDLAGDREEPSARRQRGCDLGRRIPTSVREVGCGEERFSIGRIARSSFRVPKPGEHGGACWGIRLEEVARRRVEGHGLVVRELCERPIPRGECVSHGLLARTRDRRLTEVTSKRGEIIGPALLDDLREGAMEPDATAGAELVVQRRAHQRV